MSWLLFILSICACVAIQLVLVAFRARKLKNKMPPGPPGLPLLGNILQLGRLPWLQFAEWSKKYSSIFSLSLAGQPVIVLNDFKTAGDLLDRRSKKYTGRPRFVMSGEVMTGGIFIPLMPDGPAWKKTRRAAEDCVKYRASRGLTLRQERQSALLVSDVIRDPMNWEAHFRRSMVLFVHGVLYDPPASAHVSNSVVHNFDIMTGRLTNASKPGAYLVDIFPSMIYIPRWLAKWKRDGCQFFKQYSAVLQANIQDVAARLQAGDVDPESSFCAKLLSNKARFQMNDQEAAWLAGAMLSASETAASSFPAFILALTLYPDVMRKAQGEIDKIVGRERMPTVTDREHLPYVEAMVKEVLRWRPAGPMGLPRQCTEDDWYNGHYIPKGTMVISNVWTMNRDPDWFPDYDEFRPERYLDAFGRLSDAIPDTHHQGHMSYGSGRRICPGKDVANQALFIEFATFLWAFSVSAPLDDKGKPIMPPRMEFIDQGIALRPAPFDCIIEPRSKDVSEIAAGVLSNATD